MTPNNDKYERTSPLFSGDDAPGAIAEHASSADSAPSARGQRTATAPSAAAPGFDANRLPLPVDEQPSFRRHHVRIPLLLNMLFAVVLSISIPFLIMLSHVDWSAGLDAPYTRTRMFADQVLAKASDIVDYYSWQELEEAYRRFPADGPISVAIGQWTRPQMLHYLMEVGKQPTAARQMTVAQQLSAQYGDPTIRNEIKPTPVFYQKSAMEQWVQAREVRKTTQNMYVYYTDQNLFVKPEERAELADQIPPDIENTDYIRMADEIVAPMGVESLYKASRNNLDVYRELVSSLELSVSSMMSISGSVKQTPISKELEQGNFQYSVRFGDNGNVYTNEGQPKGKAPVWSAPITLEDATIEVGEGPWQADLTRTFERNLYGMYQPALFEDVDMTLAIDTTLQAEDTLQEEMTTYPAAMRMLKITLIVSAAAFLGWLITLIVTLAWTSSIEMPGLRNFEGMLPVEVLILASGAFLLVLFYVAIEMLMTFLASQHVADYVAEPIVQPLWLGLGLAGILFNLLGWYLLSAFFRKARQGRIYRGSLLHRLIELVKSGVRRFDDGRGARHQTLLSTLLWLGVFLAAFVVSGLVGSFHLLVLLLIVVAGRGIYRAMRKDREDGWILHAMDQMEGGEVQARLDVSHFHGVDAQMADRLNHFGESLEIALARSLKNERMQTELITNVSHDLRTPLTSIISYVDLLKNTDLAPEEREEYLNVLEKKAHRLKTLMNDLIDVSKASSGAMEMQMDRLDFVEIVQQSLAELEPDWSASGLTPVFELPAQSVPVEADGQKLSRVLENLISNAQKYSQEGTRVYISVKETEKEVRFDIKNTSRYPLNMKPFELLERFNRGDKSRASEGSGLGLSIAEQLALHMGARLDLDIDGDLFKAGVVFKKQSRR